MGDGGVAGSRYIICSLSKPLALILIVKARWCMHESIFQHLFAGELIARNDLIVQFVKAMTEVFVEVEMDLVRTDRWCKRR